MHVLHRPVELAANSRHLSSKLIICIEVENYHTAVRPYVHILSLWALRTYSNPVEISTVLLRRVNDER